MLKLLETGAVAYRDYLIIADLHLGFELELARKGINVPEQGKKLIEKLEPYTKKFNKLVILGDLKHEIGSYLPIQRRLVENFLFWAREAFGEVILVRGNHDAGIEGMEPSTGIRLGKLGLFHGHAYPSDDVLEAKRLVAAHVHPVVKLGSKKLKCFVLGEFMGKELLVLPAFSDLISGVEVTEVKEKVLGRANFRELILLTGEILQVSTSI